MGIIIRWLLASIALYITVKLGETLRLPMSIEPGIAPFLAVLFLAIVNALIRPFLKLITLPLNCLTFGLFGIIINALLFWLVGSSNFVVGFRVQSFLAAMFGSIVMGVVSGLLSLITGKGK